jgi:hemolysin activation/secretion protein
MFCKNNGAFCSVASNAAVDSLIADVLLSLNIQSSSYLSEDPVRGCLKRTLVRRCVRRLMHIGGFCILLGFQFDTALAQAPTASAPKPQKINVSAVRVEGNTLLPERMLSELTAGVAGTERSGSELNQIATRVQNAYRDAGYGGVVAYIPEQEIIGGNVVVRVIEGKLTNVRVTGNVHHDAANIRAGLPNLREGTTPVVRSIDRDIQLTNDSPGKQVKVTLTAGAKPGEIDADVGVTDSKPLKFLLGYNNTGNETTGKHRVSVGLQHSNLFDRDHVGTLQYQTSPQKPDQVSIYSAGYRVPLYSQAASLDAFFARSSVSNGTTFTPAGPLSFAGKGTVVGLRANRNLDRIGEYDHHATLGLDWRDYENDCSVGVFGSAACGSAGVSVNTAPASVAYTGQKQGPRTSWGINASLAANLGGSSQATFEAARPGSKRHYVISRFSGFGEMALGAGFAVHGQLDVQYSPHALISGEKLGLGGAGSVRGYTERELAGDYGYATRIEALAPPKEVTDGFRFRPYLFVDHGRISNHNDLPCRSITETSCKLTGVGIGTRLSIGKNASATLEIGRAFENGVTTSSGDVRGHVAVNFVY